MTEQSNQFDKANNSLPDEDQLELEDETGLDIDEDNNSTNIYPNAQVRVTKDQYSVLHIKRLYEDRKELIIDPEFQRKDVWNGRQRSELIESILMGIPIPVMYFFETTCGKKQVVDGRQRITTIISYLNDAFILRDLKILSNLNGIKFSKLDTKLQGIIEDYQFSVNIIQPPTPERVKYDIFDRVNRGGTRLNSQEMRNALYNGKATKILKELSISEEFLGATEGKVNKSRMKDRYIVLRALAFYLLLNGDLKNISGMEPIEYKSDIDDFLAKVMIAVNDHLEDSIINNATEKFKLSMERIHRIMGTDAFRFKPREVGGNRRPINMLLFEVLTYMFTFDDVESDVTKEVVDEWKVKMDDTGGTFRDSIDSSPNVFARFDEVEKLLDLIRI